jgi:hypothetical protein
MNSDMFMYHEMNTQRSFVKVEVECRNLTLKQQINEWYSIILAISLLFTLLPTATAQHYATFDTDAQKDVKRMFSRFVFSCVPLSKFPLLAYFHSNFLLSIREIVKHTPFLF